MIGGNVTILSGVMIGNLAKKIKDIENDIHETE